VGAVGSGPLGALSNIAADFHPTRLPPAQCLPTSVARQQSRSDGQSSTPKPRALESESGTRTSRKPPIRQFAVGNNYSHFEVCFQGFHKDLYAAELVASVGSNLRVTQHRAIARCEPFNNTPAFGRRQLVSRSRSYKSRPHVYSD
jgi:hypothetical protein